MKKILDASELKNEGLKSRNDLSPLKKTACHLWNYEDEETFAKWLRLLTKKEEYQIKRWLDISEKQWGRLSILKRVRKKSPKKIYLFVSKNSNHLVKLYRHRHDFLENKKLCSFLNIDERNKYGHSVWDYWDNNGSVDEIKDKFKNRHLIYKVTTNFTDWIILTNNFWVLHFLNQWISAHYTTKPNKFTIPKEEVVAYIYNGKKFIPQKVTKEGIMPDFIINPVKKIMQQYGQEV